MNNIDTVIKSGDIIKKQDTFDLGFQGSIIWSKGKTKVDVNDYIISKKKEFYQKFSSIFYDSYKITVNSDLLREIVID